MALDILVVDDEEDIRDLVAGVLDDEGYQTRTAAHADEALEALAAGLGHELEFHGGHMTGRGAEALRRMVARADLVVIHTGVNSHGATQLARKAAREADVPCVLSNSCNATRLREILTSRAGEAPRTGPERPARRRPEKDSR